MSKQTRHPYQHSATKGMVKESVRDRSANLRGGVYHERHGSWALALQAVTGADLDRKMKIESDMEQGVVEVEQDGLVWRFARSVLVKAMRGQGTQKVDPAKHGGNSPSPAPAKEDHEV